MSITCEGIIHLTFMCQRADNNLHLQNFILSPWPKVIQISKLKLFLEPVLSFETKVWDVAAVVFQF